VNSEHPEGPAYYQGIIDILVANGYCGLFDGEEIEVKRTNDSRRLLSPRPVVRPGPRAVPHSARGLRTALIVQVDQTLVIQRIDARSGVA
jgi:hypothetical protein